MPEDMAKYCFDGGQSEETIQRADNHHDYEISESGFCFSSHQCVVSTPPPVPHPSEVWGAMWKDIRGFFGPTEKEPQPPVEK